MICGRPDFIWLCIFECHVVHHERGSIWKSAWFLVDGRHSESSFEQRKYLTRFEMLWSWRGVFCSINQSLWANGCIRWGRGHFSDNTKISSSRAHQVGINSDRMTYRRCDWCAPAATSRTIRAYLLQKQGSEDRLRTQVQARRFRDIQIDFAIRKTLVLKKQANRN